MPLSFLRRCFINFYKVPDSHGKVYTGRNTYTKNVWDHYRIQLFKGRCNITEAVDPRVYGNWERFCYTIQHIVWHKEHIEREFVSLTKIKGMQRRWESVYFLNAHLLKPAVAISWAKRPSPSPGTRTSRTHLWRSETRLNSTSNSSRIGLYVLSRSSIIQSSYQLSVAHSNLELIAEVLILVSPYQMLKCFWNWNRVIVDVWAHLTQKCLILIDE